jgi:hypothetical protein
VTSLSVVQRLSSQTKEAASPSAPDARFVRRPHQIAPVR